MTLPIFRVAMGMAKVVTEPAELHTIVGSGYAVAVCVPGGHGAGLLHLYVSPPSLSSKADASIEPRTIRLLRKFADSLQEIPDLNGATVWVVGGADIMHALPRSLRDSHAKRVVAPMASILTKRGMTLTHTTVGGTESRTVSVSSLTATVKIEPVLSKGGGAGRRKSAVWPAPSAAVAPPELPADPAASAEDGPKQVTVNMGCLHVDRGSVQLTALLGSCVGIALFDPTTKIGGLAHVAMPVRPEGNRELAKYADSAVPALVQELVRRGANRAELQAKLAGGGNTMFKPSDNQIFSVPTRNIQYAREALVNAGIPLLQQDVGGRVARKMMVDLRSFEMTIKVLSD